MSLTSERFRASPARLMALTDGGILASLTSACITEGTVLIRVM